ncbi:MAG: hypothetical protein CL807_07060 [Citromicrobium sp.]|nr:hypothetical protein [Citromicrobium sp.]MBD76634.1 hypothetical protein [Citromicrobium sp.]MBT47848.1 hypothetical protein [Citromicrobium sp.]|tara:strand:+ start:932 stop:1429 length:498 start_codon:yes stop_codon:yes gene_type:complete
MIRRLALAISLGSALMAAPASAQDYAPQRVVASVDTDDLKAIVGSLDHTLLNEGQFGDVSVGAESEDGTKYVLIGTACDVGDVAGCQGVMMQVRFDPVSTITDSDLARANLNEAAVLTWRDTSDGTIGVTRYVVLDYGVTMKNLRENVRVLLGITPLVVEALVGE